LVVDEYEHAWDRAVAVGVAGAILFAATALFTPDVWIRIIGLVGLAAVLFILHTMYSAEGDGR